MRTLPGGHPTTHVRQPASETPGSRHGPIRVPSACSRQTGMPTLFGREIIVQANRGITPPPRCGEQTSAISPALTGTKSVAYESYTDNESTLPALTPFPPRHPWSLRHRTWSCESIPSTPDCCRGHCQWVCKAILTAGWPGLYLLNTWTGRSVSSLVSLK